MWLIDPITVLTSSSSFSIKVYNEQIRDLLVNSGPLAVREDAQKGVVVQGLTLHQVCGLKSFSHWRITSLVI